MEKETDLAELVIAQSAVIAELRQRIDRLEERGNRSTPQRDVPVVELAPDTSRRGFLKLAGFAAAGAAAVVAGSAQPAAATDNSAINQAQVNTGSLPTTVTNTGASGSAISALKGIGPQESVGLYGISNGPPPVGGVYPQSFAVGVLGDSDGGYGVYGSSSRGYGLYSGGNGRIGMAPMGVAFDANGPSTGSYSTGDIVKNANGDTFSCVVAGPSPTAKFRKLAGPSTAGALHVLPRPVRVYDSRASGGPITSGVTRTVSLLSGTAGGSPASAVPAGAAAALFALGVVGTSGPNGWLSAFAAGTAYPGTASLNWFGAAQILNTTTWSSVDGSANVNIYCFGSTDFVVDVIGYCL